jgi:putative hydrolase of the HAD superfamily
LSADRFLIWDFDGTLAARPGEWTGAVCEAIQRRHPHLSIEPARVRPHLRSGFPWHSPEHVRGPCSDDVWWNNLFPVLASAVTHGAGLADEEAYQVARTVRTVYTEPEAWEVYEYAVPVLEELRASGWSHLILSNHVPELPALVSQLGLHPYFTAVFSSAQIGAEKPSGVRARFRGISRCP